MFVVGMSSYVAWINTCGIVLYFDLVLFSLFHQFVMFLDTVFEPLKRRISEDSMVYCYDKAPTTLWARIWKRVLPCTTPVTVITNVESSPGLVKRCWDSSAKDVSEYGVYLEFDSQQLGLWETLFPWLVVLNSRRQYRSWAHKNDIVQSNCVYAGFTY